MFFSTFMFIVGYCLINSWEKVSDKLSLDTSYRQYATILIISWAVGEAFVTDSIKLSQVVQISQPPIFEDVDGKIILKSEIIIHFLAQSLSIGLHGFRS